MSLIETPFSRRSEIQKKQILFAGRPTNVIENICIPTLKTKTKVSSRYFNTHKVLGTIPISGCVVVFISSDCFVGLVFYLVKLKMFG